MRKLILSVIIIFIINTTTSFAQETVPETIPDSITSVEKPPKNLRYSLLGGPGYTPDYGVVLGGTALMTFRMSSATLLQK